MKTKTALRTRQEDQLATIWSQSPDWDEDSINEQCRERGVSPRKPGRASRPAEPEYAVTLRLVQTFADEELAAQLEYAMKRAIEPYLATIGPVGVIGALSTACWDKSAEHWREEMLADHWKKLGKETAELHQKPYVVWINGQIEDKEGK